MPNNKLPPAPPKPTSPSEYPVGHPLGVESFEAIYQSVLDKGKTLHGGCLENRNPQLAADILWRLAQGRSRLSITRDLNVHMSTITNLMHSHSATIEAKRKEMAHVYAGVANQYVGLLQKKADLLDDDDEALKQTAPDKLAVVVGIMTDHHNKLSGMNTITIEHRKGATIDEAQATLAAIRARIAENAKATAIEAEVLGEETN